VVTPEAVLRRVRALGLPAYGDEEVLLVAETVQRYRPTHVFEWGTNVGASARLFYEAAVVLGLTCEVHTVELPDDQAHLDRDHAGARTAALLEATPEVRQHRGDGVGVALRLCGELAPERPLFFLDGCHRYECVSRELYAIAVAAPRSCVLVHDIFHPEERTGEAVRDFAENPDCGYELLQFHSQAGMARLWPTSAS